MQNSGPGGKSDVTSLVKAVVAGSIAGTSAGSSGSSSSGHKDTYGAPTSYGNSYGGSPRPNGYVSSLSSLRFLSLGILFTDTLVSYNPNHSLRFTDRLWTFT